MTNIQTIADRLNSNVADTQSRNPLTRMAYINYLPAEKDLHVYEPEAIVAYTYINRRGYPSLTLFIGRSNKPAIHCAYRSEESRDKAMTSAVEGVRAKMDRKAKNKMLRTVPHTFVVGDILYADWGYDQTNIDFYQVTKLVGNTMIEMRRIRARVTETFGTYDYVTAVKDQFYAEEGYGSETLRRKVNGRYESVSINTYCNAYRWDGKPKYATNPMFGR